MLMLAVSLFLFAAVFMGTWSVMTLSARKAAVDERIDEIIRDQYLRAITDTRKLKEFLKVTTPKKRRQALELIVLFFVPLILTSVVHIFYPAYFLLKFIFFALLATLFNSVLRIYLKKRLKTTIEEALPSSLDLMVVCIEAGMSLNAALVRVAEETKGTPLSDEFRQTFHELHMGLPSETVFRNLGSRTEVEDIEAFAMAIIQSEKLGMCLADTLRNQSKVLRDTIRMRTREKIQKLPIKLLFPLVFLIMPSTLLVLLGPAFISILQNFGAHLGK